MEHKTIRQGYLKHAVLAQLHRWYQFYENKDAELSNQLDLLTEDISVKSALGEGTGHEVYRERVEQIPTTWKNAHFVRNVNVDINKDGSTDLNIEITYLNVGLLPDNAIRSADLSYTTKLNQTETVLPKFSSIVIDQKSETTTDNYKSAYAENRLKSLMHYWLTLIEDPSRNLEPFKELLANEFKLKFSSSSITNFNEFEKWFRGPASSVTASTHVISNFSYETMNQNNSYLTVDFDWDGILPDGKEMVAKTRHHWNVLDNPKERFARIKTIDVEVIKPFAPNE